MKAFIVTVVAPNDWDGEAVVTAINIGMRKHGVEKNLECSGMFTSALVHAKFDLKRQDV